MSGRPIKIVGVNAAIFLALMALAEVALQTVATAFPAYRSLSLEPDRALGWKLVPNFSFRQTSDFWYAREFSVAVTTNDAGFRDAARTLDKPNDMRRVVVLGDSMIEAKQVPFAATATQQLEHRLNLSASSGPAPKWEVLNFGVSNYGVGQVLLAWEHHASLYSPDYVVVFVARFIMERTVAPLVAGAFPGSQTQSLWIRPTFSIENDVLTRQPARDYLRFEEQQRQLLETELDPETRSHRRPREIITARYAVFLGEHAVRLASRAVRLVRPEGLGLGRRIVSVRPPPKDLGGDVLAVNLAVIKELGRQAASVGATLIVVDASLALDRNPTTDLPGVLEHFSLENGFGYIPVWKYLERTEEEGVRTRWRYDGHFNEAGNRVLADAIFDWIEGDLDRSVR